MQKESANPVNRQRIANENSGTDRSLNPVLVAVLGAASNLVSASGPDSVPDAVRRANLGLEAVTETGCGSDFMGSYGMQGAGVGFGGWLWIRICSPEDATSRDGET